MAHQGSAYFPPAASPDAAVWWVLAWLVIGLQAVLLAGLVLAEAWFSALSIAAGLAFSLGVLLLGAWLPGILVFLVVTAAFLNAGAWSFDWYGRLIWFDDFIHFYTGFCGVAPLTYLVAAAAGRRREAALSTPALLGIAGMMGLALGLGWEIVEIILVDLDPYDTLVDIVADVFGGVLGGALAAMIGNDEKAARRAAKTASREPQQASPSREPAGQARR